MHGIGFEINKCMSTNLFGIIIISHNILCQPISALHNNAACPEDAAAIEDCEAALDDMMANMPGDTTSSASALNVAAAATVAAAASLVGATMAAMN